MRLIDADAFIEYLKEMWGKWDEDDWYEAQAKDAMKDDIEIVNKQPTVDAVQVVRCGECVHYETAGCADGYGWCNDAVVSQGTWDDFYCADGKRKEGAE